ncbi:MAG: hypothetical protein P8J32_08795 [bacterium]|nr:hypothetical protein [bacterium]
MVTKHLDSGDVDYTAIAEEVGDEGKLHLQGFTIFKNAKTFSAAKAWFRSKTIHIEQMKGTRFQAATYIVDPAKLGKEKEAGMLILESGTRPIEGAKSQWDYIFQMLHDGDSDYEIMMKYPEEFMRFNAAIGRARMTILASRLNEWREVQVEYHWGKSGTGKTRGAIESVETPQDIFRVTNYKHPFDSYSGQKVILFEEFRSSLPLEQMLNYLDGYYTQLPCRYADKVSGWDKVIICTNIALHEQYCSVQARHPESYNALLRRIDVVTAYE